MLNRLYSGLFGLVLAVASMAGPAFGDYVRVNEPNPADPMAVQIYRLDNGLTVYLTENHETPRFYAEIVVRAGSKQDPAETTGLAHYLEHLLFKGTQRMGSLDYEAERPYIERISELYEEHFAETDPARRAEIYAEINAVAQDAAAYAIPNEMDNLYNAMGSNHLNAHTSNEETVYKVSLPSNRLEHWAAVESERFTDPVFRLFHTELETVYEEKNRSLDNRNWITYEGMARQLFKVHPYGQQPTIGLAEHLKNPSLVNIQNYFDTYYVPNNMAICISGNIDPEETMAVIDRYFSAWETKPLPEPATWNEPPIEGVERTQVQFPGEEYVELAFRTVPQGHPDQAALTVADFILDNSVAGLININLNQAQRVRSAGAFHRFMNDSGSEHLSGVPKDGQTLDEVEALLLEQLGILKRGEFEDWIIEAIVTDFKKTKKAALESDMSRVTAMRDSFIAFESWDDAVARIDRIEAVTKEDVVRVANQYFGENYVVLRRIDAQNELPGIDKPQIDSIDIDPTRKSDFARTVEAIPFDEVEPVFLKEGKDFEVRKLDSGVTLYYTPNPLNDLFALSASVDKGTWHEPRLAYAAMLLDKGGAGSLGPEELKKEWYKLGTRFSFGASERSTSASISGLDENFEASLALMRSVLRDPVSDQETLDELAAISLAQRADSMKDPATISRALFTYNRWGADSPFLTRLPGDAVRALKSDALLDLVRGMLSYELTVSYTGSLPIDSVVEAIDTYLSTEGDRIAPPAYEERRARAPEQTEIYFFDKEMAQAQIRIEFGNGVYDEKDRTAIDLYNEYFAGGMSGIVFQELREARALAYMAGARYITGARQEDENLMVGVIGCQADKTPESVEAFLDLFENMPQSVERFEKAHGGIVSRYRTGKMGFRAINGAVQAWDDLGLKPDPRKKRYKQIRKADMDTMLAFHAERIAGTPKLISIVGDKSKIDMENVGEIAPVTYLTLDDIFVR